MSMLVHDLGLSRRACDRCHGQKLRCRRENSNEPCIRCQRAGVQCALRPIKSRNRPRAQSTQHTVPMPNSTPTQPLEENPAEQTTKDVPGNFHLSPSSLLDFSSDLDLGMDFASPQSEMGNGLETRDLQSSMDLGSIQSHPQIQTFPQEPRSRMYAEFEPEHHSNHHGASQGSDLQNLSTSTMLPCSQQKTTPSRHRLSLARTVVPKQINKVTLEANGLMDFEHRDSMTLNTESESSAATCGYGQSGSNQPPSNGNGIQDSISQQTSNPTGSVTSWVYKLSDINVELHQHMQAIMSVDVEHGSWINSKESNGPSTSQELAVDRTLKLSHQYTEILNDVFSQCKTSQVSTGSPPAALGLDQPSQLLVLSSYLCLVESYDQILQHIRAWTEVRWSIGESVAEEHRLPVQLPSVTIGCFQLPALSSTQTLVLICIIEATMTQIHDQVNEVIRPMRATGEQGTLGSDGLSGVAKVTVQAIRTKEDATLKLLHKIWQLALQYGGDNKPGAGAT